MSESATRDVVFRLRVEVDATSRERAKTELDSVAKFYADLEAASKQQAEAEARNSQNVVEGIERREKAVAQMRNEYERHTKASEASSRQISEGFKMAMEGAFALGRGYAALKIAADANQDSNVRMLAGFVGVSELLKGSINLIEGATKSWEGYRVAIESINKAKAAGIAIDAATGLLAGPASLAGSAGGRAAGAGISGGVAAGAGAAGGAAAGAGLSGAAGFAAAAAPLAILAGAAIAATAAIFGVAAIFSKDLKEGIDEFLGMTNRAADALKREADHREKLESRTAAMDGRTDGILARLAASERSSEADMQAAGNRYQFDDAKRNEEQRNIAQSHYLTTASHNSFYEGGGGGEINRLDAAAGMRKAEESAMAKIVELEKERATIAIAAADKQVASAKELLENSKQTAELAQRQYETEKRRVESAEQRLAGLDPVEAGQVKRAAEKAQRGEQLSSGDANQLRGLGLYDEQVQAADRRRVSALGLDPVLDPARQAAAGAKYHADETKIAVAAATEFNVKLTSDKAALVTSLGEAMAPLVDQWRAAVAETVKAEVAKSMRDITIKSNTSAKVNG